jgi:hypothetical protein
MIRKLIPIKIIIELFVVFILLLFISCSSKNDNALKSNEISIFKNNLESLNSSQFVDSISFIALETNSKNIIGSITKLIKTNDKYFILDTKSAKKLLVFSITGRFLYSIGNLGKGPGEYLNIMDFTIDDKNNYILIIDNLQKIIKTDLDGNFISEKKVPKDFKSFTNIVAQDGLIYTYSGLSAGNTKKYQIIQFDRKLDPIRWLLPYKYPLPGQRRFNNALYSFENNIYFVSFYDNVIYQRKDDTFEKRYLLNFSGKELPLKGLTSEQFVDNKVNTFLFNSCVEGDDIIFLSIFDKGKPKYGFLLKRNNKFLLIDKINQEYPPFCIPIAYYKNKFISTIESQIFEKIFPASSIKPDKMDNPIIVEYKIAFKNEK